jgi:molecular chaperone DnaK
VTIHVLQGERKQAGQNKSLGQFDLSDIPPAPRGTPQIEVSFDLDANGILNVSAKDKASGKEQSIVIKASSGLSDEEVEQMVRDAEAHADEDRKFEELVGVRNMADGMIHATRKTLEEAGDKVEESEKTAIEGAISELEEALKADDKDDIEAKTQKLTEASSSLAQRMYAEAQEGAEQASDEAPADSGGDPDAVDAEFEEVKDDK